MAISQRVLQDLRAIVGEKGYLDQPEDLSPFLTDYRQLYHGTTPLVLRPDSTAQVADILRCCHHARVGVVPVGGNTGYCGGATPSEDGSEIVLSLARMCRVHSIDPLNYALVAEAGCLLEAVQAAARDVDRLFPLSLGSEGSCQLGGTLSTNAGGTAALRYGTMRDLVLGIQVVLPDGRVLDDLTILRKDNTGYDLRDLFIGAEGTLGVITAAACKLFPLPASLVTALVAISEPQAAVALLAGLRDRTGDAVTTFELVPRLALDLVLRHVAEVSDPLAERSDWYVLLELSGGSNEAPLRDVLDSELARAMEGGAVTDAVVAASEAQRQLLWRLRESIPEAQSREGANVKHDVSVSTTELPRFLVEAEALVRRLSATARIVAYGHLGDGNLHFNVSPGAGEPDEALIALAPRISRAVHDLVADYGGSFSAEHGIGRLKRDELARYKDPVALELMRSIKRTLDPNGIMNPGKVL